MRNNDLIARRDAVRAIMELAKQSQYGTSIDPNEAVLKLLDVPGLYELVGEKADETR